MHLHGQHLSGVLKKFSISSSFFLAKNANKKVFEDKCFLSKVFYQIKMHAATNWFSHLKKHQTFEFFSNDRFFMQFSKITFSEIFENHQ